MKKAIIVALVTIIVVAGGAFVLHKSPPKPASAAQSPTSSTANTTTANNAVIITKSNAALGTYLADPNGNALYTYNADTMNVSNCTGSCLVSWPAYQDKGATTNLPTGVGTIKRHDNGQIQFTYNGMPLYYFSSDSNGQVTGNGVANFSVAKPTSSSTSTNAPQTNPAPATTSTPSSNSSNSW